MKKFISAIIYLAFFSTIAQGAIISQGDWKLDVNDRSGRFKFYYKDFPLNQPAEPLSSYFSLQVGKEIYHLGDDIGVHKLDARPDKIVATYRISAQLLVEISYSFTENPLVYDDLGLKINARIDSRFVRPNDLILRFLFDTFVSEDKLQGYKTLTPGEEITVETKRKLDTLIFYPFFIRSVTAPSFAFLSSWQRQQETFLPRERSGLNFRDIRTSEWDPAAGFFHELGSVAKRAYNIEFFIGLWQKPDRTYPRIKILHPNEISLKRDSLFSAPFLVENNGDFTIDMVKIVFNSPFLKNQIIHSGEQLSIHGKKQIVFNGELIRMPERFTGEMKVSMWIGDKVYDQSFQVNFDIKYPPVIKEKTTGKKEARPLPDSKKLESLIERVNLLLYFVNRAIQSGISDEILLKIQKEVQSFDSPVDQPAKKD